MAIDVFNNPSNDYVVPALSPCAGASDDKYLQFLNKGIGIISGSNTLAKIDLGNIKIPVNSYSTETRTLKKGEVTYIPGLSKGLQKKQQGFNIPYLVSDDIDLNTLFFSVDLSVSYYKNFKFYYDNIDASANYSQNINIEDALNISLVNAGLNISAYYDSSILKFTGAADGYEFNISNIDLSLIDSSENLSSPFPKDANLSTYKLDENMSFYKPYAKYPNGGMTGIIMRGIYTGTTPYKPYDKWLNINHVSNSVILYTPISIDNYIYNIQVNFDPSISFGPFISDISSAIIIDVSNGSGSYPLGVIDSSFYNYNLSDSSIYKSNIINSGSIIKSIIEKSNINIFLVDPSERINIQASIINDSSIWNSSIQDTSIYNSIIYDVSLINCTLYNCIFDTATFENCIDIRINQSLNISTTYIDSSIYYSKTTKKVDVGMNGSSTDDTISAGDYLDWVNTNNYWYKFGDIYFWTSAQDGCESCYNSINGFYVFNPQQFDCKIECLVFN